MTTTTSVRSATLDVPGARLFHEVRGSGPLTLLVGAPMDARAFAPLADALATDRTVVTTDPRGILRSPVTGPVRDSTPALRADDLARLVEHLDAGPAAVLGSSGGACTALALAAARPDLVDVVVAHEPPALGLLPDAAELHAGTRQILAAYAAGDVVGAWRTFFDQAGIVLPPGAVEQWFGGEREAQVVADERQWFEHELSGTTTFLPDVEALRGCRVVVGIGEASAGQLCERTSTALALALGVEPVRFPGGHGGFTEDPAAFAERLRTVL